MNGDCRAGILQLSLSLRVLMVSSDLRLPEVAQCGPLVAVLLALIT